MDPSKFRDLMQRSGSGKELLLPDENARWEGNRYTLDRTRRVPSPTIKGVRLQEPDPNHPASFPERACQEDLANLLRSLTALRADPNLSGLVLSDETLMARDASQTGCRRVLFGLRRDNQFREEAAAAQECHRVLSHAFQKAGFRVRPPDSFDPSKGMNGLVHWAGTVRLEPHRTFSRKWLLALLPLLLLLFLPFTCNSGKPSPTPDPPKDNLFGLPLESDSFLILMDKSGSMQPYFDDVRKEAKRLLDSKRAKGKCYADIIVFDSRAISALGRIEELSDANAGKLGGYLDAMQSGGGTDLRTAVDLAIREVNDHGRRTTLFILTDGEDGSVQGIIHDKDDLAKRAGKGGVVVHTTTPRLFTPGANGEPTNNAERGLRDLSRAFQGQFGPNPER